MGIPYITGEGDLLPAGRFHLPLCVTADEVQAIRSALYRDCQANGFTDTRAWDIFLDALQYVSDPENAPCVDCAGVGGCQQFPALWEGLSYFPNNPRLQNQPTPTGWSLPPWYIVPVTPPDSRHDGG